MRRCLLILGAIFLAGAGAWLWLSPSEGPPPEPAWFEDVTAASGIDFIHDAGPLGNHFMPQIMGSGVAVFDFDNDGRLDVYLLSNGGPKSAATNRLYRQAAPGRFTDVSAASGLDLAGHNMGVSAGDVNNDGWLDVLVTQYGGIRLLLNNRDGKSFTDATQTAGLVNPLWGLSAVLFDYDRDGWLDLAVANYIDYDPTWPCTSATGAPEYCTPHAFAGRVTKLWRNRGADVSGQVRFEDRTIAAGLAARPGPGLGIVAADFDGDGWPDLFVANDGKPNHLWLNRRDGTFREEAAARGVAFNGMGQPEAGMGIALGDADGDGFFDLFVTHLTEETNTLWRQGPRGVFTDRTAATCVAATVWRGTGFGTLFADFDHDGAADLALVNGRVGRGHQPAGGNLLGPHWTWYAERNQLLANDGAGRFHDRSPKDAALCGTPNVARGLAAGDLDDDGALDLIVTTVGGPVQVLRNVAPQRGSWLIVRALDPALKRDAYGAEVRVLAGGRSWVRLIQAAGSYLSSSDPRAHFGLAERKTGFPTRPLPDYDGIEVLWPDGMTEAFPAGATNRAIVLRRGEGVRSGPR